MTPEEFLENLNGAVERIAKDMEPVMQEAALTGKALLAKRVQNTGFGATYRSRSYVRLRARRGYEIRFVNLTYTGNMFRGWTTPANYRRGLVVGGSVGGSDQATRNKLRWNKSRFPVFDQSSDEEKEVIKDNLVNPRLMESVRKNLGL